MNFNELENYLSTLPDKILDDAAEIVAETATEYYKERFREKAFDGNPWAPAKAPRRNGSLLIDSGNLMDSIRPAHVRHTSKYGNVEVKEHTRRADIPARPFMGRSDELADRIHHRLEGFINTLK